MSKQPKQHTVITAFQDKFTKQLYAVGSIFASDDPERISFLQDEGYLGDEVVAQPEVKDDDLLSLSADKIVKALAAEEKEAAALQILLDKEKDGKNRKSVVETLETMLLKRNE